MFDISKKEGTVTLSQGKLEYINMTSLAVFGKPPEFKDGAGSPKYRQISRAIEALVREKKVQPGQRLPSDRILAKHFGVTTTTLGKGLQEVASKGLLVRKVGNGTFVASPRVATARKERRLGVFCHYQMRGDYWASQVMDALGEYWRVKNYEIVNLELPDDGYLVHIKEYGITALAIVSPLIQFKDSLLQLKDRGEPFVVIGNVYDSIASHCFSNDDAATLAEAVSYLYDLGHRDIGVIPGYGVCPTSWSRYNSFLREMWRKKLPINPDWIACGGASHRDDGFDPVAWFKNLMSCNDRPSAFLLFWHSDLMKIYTAAQEMGVKIGKDISIIGFDDPGYAAHLNPPLTAFAQPIAQITKNACEFLQYHIEGGDKPEIMHYSSRLIKRSSCVCLLA